MDNLPKIAIIAIATIIPAIAFAVWSADQPAPVEVQDEKITVIASFYPLYDFTKNIGGDKVNVEILVQDGVEPHDWEPSIRDVENMQKADMIVINGIGFESWIDDFAEINIDTKIVDTSKGITILEGSHGEHEEEHGEHEEEHGEHEEEHGEHEEEHGEHEEEHGEHLQGDPHIWLNPVLVKTQVTNISNALANLDPDNAYYYEANTKSYITKLDSLDQKIQNELSSCSDDFIAYHNAFSYFANEYGLHQHTIIASGDHHAEPTPKTFQTIIELAKERNIDVIFTEEGIDQRTLDVISKEIGGKVLVLSPIEIGDVDSNYILRMEQNLTNLKEALC